MEVGKDTEKVFCLRYSLIFYENKSDPDMGQIYDGDTTVIQQITRDLKYFNDNLK